MTGFGEREGLLSARSGPSGRRNAFPKPAVGIRISHVSRRDRQRRRRSALRIWEVRRGCRL